MMKGSSEPKLVETTERIVQSLEGFRTEGKAEQYLFEIATDALFIHGSKSQVTFDCYGRELQRELGDLIFIVSLVFQNTKYVEKVTINQFKKAKEQTRVHSWDIRNKEQLYLLSDFQSFRVFRDHIFLIQAIFFRTCQAAWARMVYFMLQGILFLLVRNYLILL